MNRRRYIVPTVGLVLCGLATLVRAETCKPFDDSLLPPWQRDADDDALRRGLEFTVPQVDVLADFHGDLTDPKLVLYVGGNSFFAMGPLVQAFESEHPDLKGKLFWETIPPGLLAKQMAEQGRITVGNMTFAARPDAFLAGQAKIEELVRDGRLEAPVVRYATNRLTIMIPKDNPGRVHSLADLGRPDIRLAMPNPAFEGVALLIKRSLARAGGTALADAVYTSKVADGSTVLTRIHHRQTPLFLMQGRVEAGVTWLSEALYQEQLGHPIRHVEIPANDNAMGIYAGSLVRGAPHPDAAKAWLAFIASPRALAILERYGFASYRGNAADSGR